jgi:hypothetical protein
MNSTAALNATMILPPVMRAPTPGAPNPHVHPDNHPELFPWVLFMMSIIAFECFMIPFVYTVRVRSQVFNKDFMMQFEREHKEAFPEDDKFL